MSFQKFYHDKKYRFNEYFNTRTGLYIRSGVLDENGRDTGNDPFMRSFPALLDVGIMGSCVHGRNGLCAKAGVQCYQDGLNVSAPDMTLENFRRIAEQCRNRTYQFALGGRGDPDCHADFGEILKCCRDNGIVPNFTTSGLCLTPEKAALCKEYCGAVAVSWYRQEHTLKAIETLVNAGVKTNIHYVLGNNSIDEALERLENNDFPKGVNAVVFLLHKPVGLGQKSNMLRVGDERVGRFFRLACGNSFDFKIGFDSCSVPAVLNYGGRVERSDIDTCEGARWSAYITPDMKMLPCSFDNCALKWAYDISDDTIENAWNSDVFEDFRDSFRRACPDCPERESCMGGCPIIPEIVLCERRDPHENTK